MLCPAGTGPVDSRNDSHTLESGDVEEREGGREGVREGGRGGERGRESGDREGEREGEGRERDSIELNWTLVYRLLQSCMSKYRQRRDVMHMHSLGPYLTQLKEVLGQLSITASKKTATCAVVCFQ